MNPTIQASNLNITQLARLGRSKLDEEHAAKEVAKQGILRAGNTGVVTDDGIVGACPRQLYLRVHGVSAPIDKNRDLMFEAGYTNEDSWDERLAQAWRGKIYREEECGISWEVEADGQYPAVPITGRPDCVLARNDGTYVVGLEYKLVGSVHTAKAVHHDLKPRVSHLAQSCHYMWQHNIPWKLLYTSRVDYPYYKDGPDVQYGSSGKPFKMLPFVREYNLTLREGRLYYKTEGLDDWVKTNITVQGIIDYYHQIVAMMRGGEMAARPIGKDAIGDSTYKLCGYCEFANVCDKYENDLQSWFDACALVAEGVEF